MSIVLTILAVTSIGIVYTALAVTVIGWKGELIINGDDEPSKNENKNKDIN